MRPLHQGWQAYGSARAVANAVGIPDSGVIWDPSGNIILTRDNLVTKLAIGSETLLANGTEITMDVAPRNHLWAHDAANLLAFPALGLSLVGMRRLRTVRIAYRK